MKFSKLVSILKIISRRPKTLNYGYEGKKNQAQDMSLDLRGWYSKDNKYIRILPILKMIITPSSYTIVITKKHYLTTSKFVMAYPKGANFPSVSFLHMITYNGKHKINHWCLVSDWILILGKKWYKIKT